MSSLARNMGIINIQIEVHWWAVTKTGEKAYIVTWAWRTLAGPDGVFGRHKG